MSEYPKTNGIAGVVLAVVIGLVGAALWAHWSVCEQDDRQCAFTGAER